MLNGTDLIITGFSTACDAPLLRGVFVCFLCILHRGYIGNVEKTV